MDEENTIESLQNQIDQGLLDTRALNDEQREAMLQAEQAGVLNFGADGFLALEEKQKSATVGILREAQEARPQGIDTPVGTLFDSRADYELVGDLVGSIAPFLANSKDIANSLKETGRGVGPQRPGLFNFAQANSKFADDLTAMANKLPGRPGKVLGAFARTINFARKTGSKIFQLGESAVTSKSVLSPIARAELRSLQGGAVGAGLGSLGFDVARYNSELSSNAILDLNDVSTAELDQGPESVKVGMHALNAMVNSTVFGVAGTTAGHFAARAGRGVLKGMLGLNRPNAVKLAALAKEQNINLNLAQLADDEGFPGFIKSFFRIFGVTPFVADAGRRMSEKELPKVFRAAFSASEEFAPFGHAEVLGAEGLQLMKQNYFRSDAVVEAQYNSLRNFVKDEDIMVVPTEHTKKFVEDFENKFLSGGKFEQVLKNTEDPRVKSLLNNFGGEFIELIRGASGTLVKKDADGNVIADATFDRMGFMDVARFKAAMNNLLKVNKSSMVQKLGRKFIQGLDNDLASVENIAVEQLFKKTTNEAGEEVMENAIGRELISRLGSEEAAIQKITQAKDMLKKANTTFYNTISTFETKVAKRLKLGESELLTPEMVNRAQVGFTPKEMFDSMIKNVFRSKDADTINQFAKIIGVDSGDAQISAYAKDFMKRAASRHFYDSLLDAMDEGAKRKVFPKDVLQVRKELKDADVNTYQYLDEISRGVFKGIETPGLMKQVENIKNPVVKESLMNSLKIQSKDLDFDAVINLEDGFKFDKFRQNLGLDTIQGQGAFRAMVGDEQYKRVDELINILEAVDSVGFTKPSSFLARRAGLTGVQLTGGAIAGGLVFGGGASGENGLFTTIATFVLMRRAGKILTDPKSTSALLDLYTPAERAALNAKPTLRNYLGIPRKDQASLFGTGIVIDPLKPLGQYYGPKRTRSLATFLNAAIEQDSDKMPIDPNKVTLNDIDQYLNNLGSNVDTPSVDVFQLPDDTLLKFFPDAYMYKYAPDAEKRKMLDLHQGQNKAEEQSRVVPQTEAPTAPPVEEPVEAPQLPVAPEQTTTAAAPSINLRQNYASLFPEDATGQAIAQSRTS